MGRFIRRSLEDTMQEDFSAKLETLLMTFTKDPEGKSQEILALTVNADLKAAIPLIWAQVLAERENTRMFAQLIRRISDAANAETGAQAGGSSHKSLGFARALLAHLQEVFEMGLAGHDGNVPAKGSEEYEKWNKMLACMQLIGELYNIDVVTPKIIHSCIRRLLIQIDSPEPGDIEACCVLLAVVGDALDRPREGVKGCRYVDEYFDRLTKITEVESITQRLRCLCFDLIQMRHSKWKVHDESMLNKLLNKVVEESFKLPPKKKKKKKKGGGQSTCSSGASLDGDSGMSSGNESRPTSPTAYGVALLARMSGKASCEGSDDGSTGSVGGSVDPVDPLPWPRRQRSLCSESTDGPMSPWSPSSATADPLSLTYSDSGDNSEEGTDRSDCNKEANPARSWKGKRSMVSAAKLEMLLAQVHILTTQEIQELQIRIDGVLAARQRDWHQPTTDRLAQLAVNYDHNESSSPPVSAQGPPAASIGPTPNMSRRGSDDEGKPGK